jgi:tRNA1(Val) A37 N6-methylase TrmN6
MTVSVANEAAWKEDRLLAGRLALRQPVRGHRAGTDAILLAAAAPADFAGRAVDVGSGVGAVGLALALHSAQARVRLVEIDPEMAQAARHNIALNGFAARIDVIEADMLARRSVRVAAGIAGGDADLVLTNPPFAEDGSGRASPDLKRAKAHVMARGALDDWIKACADMLRPRGTLIVIHRADALPALLDAMHRRFGAVTVLPVYPRAGAPAVRILVRGVKGSRAPFSIGLGLILHEADGRFTEQAESLHRGERHLTW